MLRFFGIDPKQSPNIQPLVEFKHKLHTKTHTEYIPDIYIYVYIHIQVGGFNPIEKYSSNWLISPIFVGENFKNIWVATSDVTFPSRQPRNSGGLHKSEERLPIYPAGRRETTRPVGKFPFWEVSGVFGLHWWREVFGVLSMEGFLQVFISWDSEFGGWKTSIFVVVPVCVPLWANKDGVSCCWLYIVMYVVLSYLNLKQLHPASWWMKQPSVIYSTCLSLALLLTPSDKYWKHGMYRRIINTTVIISQLSQ